MDYHAVLEQVKRKLGKSPRRFHVWDKLTWYKQDFPDWDWQNDDIRVSVNHWDKVFRYGTITWGHIIQVNKMMFEESDWNCPGEVLIWQETTQPFDVDAFQLVAEKLYEMKGDSASLDDAFENEYAAHLEDEFERQYGVRIPDTISNGLRMAASSIFFQRRHIPNAVISSSLFPVLYLEEKPMVTAMVPYRFWPKDFLEQW